MNIDIQIFESPLSIILAVALVLCVIVFRRSRAAGMLSSRLFSVVSLLVFSVFVAVEGIWGLGLFHSWPFILVVLLLILSLGLIVISDWNRRSYSALAAHLGVFLILFGGMFGGPDVTDVQMKVSDGESEHMAYDSDGKVVALPFSIVLDEFTAEYYEDNVSPRQYTSRLSIDGKEFRTSVNHPCRYKGYRIYQSGFDTENGRYSVLKIVRDPWLPLLALGAVLLFFSALYSLGKIWDSWKIPACAIALAIVFAFISVARINFGTLIPALRSLWFIPHLIVYMLAYSILAMAVVTGIVSLFTARIPAGLSGRLLSTASSLLLIGMLCGAVWAKQAWGDYWTWDAKECWAAVTWMLTLAGIHLSVSKKTGMTIIALLAFAAMQMTWYGVNYLPSAGHSLHTYNQNTEVHSTDYK